MSMAAVCSAAAHLVSRLQLYRHVFKSAMNDVANAEFLF